MRQRKTVMRMPLMLDYRGQVAEATGANVFFIKDGVIHTPTPDCFLNGITRQTVLDLARARQIEIVERVIMPEEMSDFSECFLTGTAAEVTPVSEIGEYRFTPGEICKAVSGMVGGGIAGGILKQAAMAMLPKLLAGGIGGIAGGSALGSLLGGAAGAATGDAGSGFDIGGLIGQVCRRRCWWWCTDSLRCLVLQFHAPLAFAMLVVAGTRVMAIMADAANAVSAFLIGLFLGECEGVMNMAYNTKPASTHASHELNTHARRVIKCTFLVANKSEGFASQGKRQRRR
ncbi:putative branched-chain-amino-acid aminotransferase [Nymphon striatum]|nr:putative branched-chain-amino-acid aminotransferase [Nymphon striatum]